MPKEHRINFDDLKARAAFRAILQHYGLTLVGAGDQAKVRCPFHDDERPSCSVNLAKGLFHCFSCQAKGNVLDFVHRMETRDGQTVSLRQAALTLASICSIAVPGSERRQEPRTASTAKETASSPSRGQNHAQRGSERQKTASGSETEPKRNKPLGFRLTLDPEHSYLASRGIGPELVELFGLGFCANGSMAGRICISIENAAGELVAYAGRWVGTDEDLPEGEEKYKLPKGFHKALELWNLHRVRHCKHLIIVEGYFGAMRLHGLRLPAVALMGSSLSDEQVVLLRDCPALRFVTVMLDGDEAGQKAVDNVIVRLAKHWWTRKVTLPDGTQPDTVDDDVLAQLFGRDQK
jgi:DNA primase